MNAGLSFTRSSHKLVGCLVSAAVRALPSATSGVVAPAPSSRSSRSGTPASSTITIDTFHLFLSASALHAAIILWASSDVRQGFVRMTSPYAVESASAGEFPLPEWDASRRPRTSASIREAAVPYWALRAQSAPRYVEDVARCRA